MIRNYLCYFMYVRYVKKAIRNIDKYLWVNLIAHINVDVGLAKKAFCHFLNIDTNNT